MSRDLVLLGASAGGVTAFRQIVAKLPSDLPASILICNHLSPDSPALLGDILDRAGPMPAATAVDGERFERGRIYVAAPDHHLLVDGDTLRLHRGPRENRARPAIDALFRTAAAACGPRVLAGVLTGWLDDGTAGLLDVKACGGATFAQDPETAEAFEMPESAVTLANPDDVVSLEDIPALILQRVHEQPTPADVSVPDVIRREAEHTFDRGDDYDLLDEYGELSGLSCPDCGGPMWHMGRDGQMRVRCHTGHAHSEKAFLAAQRAEVERALGTALRVLEERARMWRRLERKRRGTLQTMALQRAEEAENEAAEVRKLLVAGDAIKGRRPPPAPRPPESGR